MKVLLILLFFIASNIFAQQSIEKSNQTKAGTYKVRPRVFFGLGSEFSSSPMDGKIASFENFNLRLGKKKAAFQEFTIGFFSEAGLILFNENVFDNVEVSDFYLPIYIKLGPELKINDNFLACISFGGFLLMPNFYPYLAMNVSANYIVELSKYISLEIESGTAIMFESNHYPLYLPYIGLGFSFN